MTTAINVKIAGVKVVGARRDGSEPGYVAIEVTAPVTNEIYMALDGCRSATLTLNDADRWGETWRCKSCARLAATCDSSPPGTRGVCPNCGTPQRWSQEVER